jgi:alpha-glucosidase (family GH31 glycosyl hydrolase)
MAGWPGGVADGDGRRRFRASFSFSGEQHFYGLGQGGGPLDRLGVTRQLWNSHLGHGPGTDTGIPLLVSSRGWALFFDNPSDATLAVGRSDNGVRIAYAAEAGALTWYFLIGESLRGCHAGDRGPAGPRVAAAALGAGLSPVDAPFRGHRGAA